LLTQPVDGEDKASTKDLSLVELKAFTQEKRQAPGFGGCEVHGSAGEPFKVFSQSWQGALHWGYTIILGYTLQV
jgi:hypothetical protein